jgi:hypothetical protein
MDKIKRIILAVAVSGITTIGLLPAGAAASGPAAPGKKVVQLECEGLGTLTASMPQAEGSAGALQIVGQNGHLIVVSSLSAVLDFTTEMVLKHETRESGGGQGHPNQPTTTCTSIFEGTASEFYGSGALPPGVGPNDFIVAGFDDQVIVKP